MHIKSIAVKNFRNLNLETELSPGLNFVIAGNGAGKSNLLDSIFQLSHGHSFKPSNEGGNINWKSRVNFAKLSAALMQERLYELQLIISELEDRNLRSFSINGRRKARRAFINMVGCVLFAPQDLDIISGSPEVRRSELNDFLSQIDDEYSDSIKSYRLILKNRNKLLQRIADGFADIKELAYWDERLVHFGSNIMFKRNELLEQFRPVLKQQAEDLFNAEVRNLGLEYISKFTAEKGLDAITASFHSKLEDNAYKEISAKKTLYGPHRDDFELNLNKRPLKYYGSRGQQRLAALILKLAMLDFLEQLKGESIILLLDDVMSELDKIHRANLEKILQKMNSQIVITATDKSDFTPEFLASGKILNLL